MMVNLFTIQPPRYAEKLFVEHNTQRHTIQMGQCPDDQGLTRLMTNCLMKQNFKHFWFLVMSRS